MRRLSAVLAMLTLLVTSANGDVFNMGPGITSLELVPVGNPGNEGEASGGMGGAGPSRVCGAVDYEYFIGAYEVTTRQYTEFLNAVAADDTYGLYNLWMWTDENSCMIQRSGEPGRYTYSVAADRVNRPVGSVSFWDACRFANWLHNGQPTGAQNAHSTEDGAYTLNGYTGDYGGTIARNADARFFVPNEDEWYKAAYHKNDVATQHYWDYPMSSDWTPTNVLTEPDQSNSANFFRNGYTIGAPYYTNIVGAFANSGSPYGTFDQGGNLWEWTETIRDGFSRVLRGGAYRHDVMYLRAWNRHLAYYPAREYSTTGFRVAFVPEPGSVTLLVCGGIVLLAYAWRKPRRR